MGFVTGHTDWAFPMKLLKLPLSRVLAPLVIFAGLAFLPGCGDRDSMERASTGMCAYKEISRIESPSKLRIAVTGKTNSPDLYTVMQLLGSERTAARIRAAMDRL